MGSKERIVGQGVLGAFNIGFCQRVGRVFKTLVSNVLGSDA